jgi:hypothetical protein
MYLLLYMNVKVNFSHRGEKKNNTLESEVPRRVFAS